MYQDDYKRANLQMLPSIEKTSSRTNRQIVLAPFSIATSIIDTFLYWTIRANVLDWRSSSWANLFTFRATNDKKLYIEKC